MKKFIYRVLENDEVVAIFNEQQYAQDFIAYEKTISDKQFEIEKVDIGVPSAYEEFVSIRNRFKNFAVILYI
ncbi:Uncharacterised protein [Enterococcus faecalis]|uniref:hypothetical protein n=1 Tax=Enterococcus faecalis TaxID=1351 RepID=UPI000E07537D|nr:hypothetical protein [Enterococcus faecalis]STP93413.1 Uncharacterised protein [Enterococcus faecalis]